MTGEPPPTIGRIVVYTSHVGDGITSPAIVLRTVASTKQDILDAYEGAGTVEPVVPGGEAHETIERPEGLGPLDDAMHVDLLVHGLTKDYRKYNVPRSVSGAPGSWDWPERV
jgi:hypothetical protein